MANVEFIENRFNNLHDDDCRTGHYDLSQLDDKLATGEQLLNVGRFERIGTPPPASLMMDGEIVSSSHYALHHRHSNAAATNGLLERSNLGMKSLDASIADGNNSDGGTASISSSGVSSVCGTTGSSGGSNGVSPSSYASACCSSSCNSSAADSTCSQSPPPLSTSSSSNSSAKLACKLLAKLLANSNGQLDNEHLSAKNLQLKLQLNEQLNKQFSKINEQNQMSDKFGVSGRDDYLLTSKSSSMSVINHNNNYLKNVELYKPSDFKANHVNKSMINLNQYNQLNDYQFKANESNLDEIIVVKTNNQLGSPKFRLNNSTSNLSTFKSISTKSDGVATGLANNKSSIVSRQIEHLEQLNETIATPTNLFKNQNNEDDLSSASSSILSTFKYSGSDKSYVTAKGEY